MADNTTLNVGVGGDTMSTDDIAGIKVPRSKIMLGADGVNDGDVSSANPMPVSVASLPSQAVTNAGTFAVQAAQTGVWTVTGAGGTFPVTGPLTDAQLRAVAVPISVASIPSHAVTNAGTFAVQATQASAWVVSGSVSVNVGLTNAELRATPVPISGSITVTGGLTDAELRATPVPVSGTVAATVTNATAVNLKAEVIGTGTFVVQATLAAETTKVIGTVNIAAAQTLATVTTVGTVTTVTTVATVTNLSQLGGAAIAMNTGTRSAGTQRVTIATDDIVPASQSGVWTVQPGNTANSTAWLVNNPPVTTGGLTVSSFLSTAAVQSTAIKGSAGQVYALEFFNIGATPMYVRLYNQTGAPAAGDNANIIWRGVIPGNTAGAGFVKTWGKGLPFSAGIGMRCTGAIADTDNTALAANTVIGNVDYK